MGDSFDLKDVKKSYGASLFGLSRNNNDVRETTTDDVGYAFFTRPLMNFSKDNLKRDRILKSLSSENEASVESYVRSMLDPMLYYDEGLDCPFADPLQPFIPILTNNVVSISGFQDISVESWSSTPGVRKQEYVILDGISDLYGAYDITATFDNTYEDSVSMLFSSWVRYVTKAFDGTISPYRKAIARRYVDSHISIYRLVLTEDKKYVKRIGVTGPSVIDVDSVGKYFDFSRGTGYNEQIKTHSIKFKTMGLWYNDPIIMLEFNKLVGAFNPYIKAVNDGKSPESVGLVKMSNVDTIGIDNRGYCRINLKTKELEWYMIKED